MTTSTRFSFAAALLLAAGRSERMGKPKLLLPWGRTSILGHLLEQWQQIGVGQIAVVCAKTDALVQQELDRLGVAAKDRIFNPAPERGMFSSIQSAARWSGWREEVTHVAIVLGDQPHVRRQTLEALLAFTATQRAAICQPLFRGHRRHPVVVPRDYFAQAAVSQAGNLKEFLASLPAASEGCETDDPGLALDIDRPEDYQEALKRFGPVEKE